MKSDRLLSLLLLPGLAATFLIVQPAAGSTQDAAGQNEVSANQPSSAAPPAADTQVTDQQRGYYRAGNATLAKLRSRTQDAVHHTAAPSINLDAVRHSQKQIREQIASVEKSRSGLYAALTESQQKSAHARMQQLNRLQARIQRHVNAVDQTIDAPSLDTHRLVEEARLTERAARAYTLHYHEMGDELGLTAE